MRLAAVTAIDGQPPYAERLEQRFEDLQVGQVGEDVVSLGRPQRSRIVGRLTQRGGRVVGIPGERIGRRVVMHSPTLTPCPGRAATLPWRPPPPAPPGPTPTWAG